MKASEIKALSAEQRTKKLAELKEEPLQPSFPAGNQSARQPYEN